jgi:hypothetical protein
VTLHVAIQGQVVLQCPQDTWHYPVPTDIIII